MDGDFYDGSVMNPDDIVLQLAGMGTHVHTHEHAGLASGEEVVFNGTFILSEDNNSVTLVYDDLDAIPLFQGYPTALLRFASLCCLLFMMVGIPGNLITIIALFRCKKVGSQLGYDGQTVRNATAVFIINLSVSDLMSCCFNLPLAASTFWQRGWHHGHMLCQLFPLMRYGLLAVSLFTVLAITINRYVMIGHPTLYPKLYRRQYLGMMVACTWVSGFGALVATWLGRWGRFGLDQQIGSCSILPDAQGRSPKQFLFMVAFVIPCICIVVCYAKIFYIVRRTAMKSRLTNNARNNNVAVGYPMPTSSTTSSSALNSASTNFTTASNRPGGLFSKNSSGFAAYYTRGSGRSKLLRKNRRPSYSIGEDSAVGSSSTEAPSFSTTEKSSSLTENGNSTSTTTTTYDIIPVIRMVTIQTDLPDPHLLSPNKSVVLPDVSSSSGIENPLGDDERDAVLSRSVTPTSMCGSSHPASPTPSRRRSINRKRYRKERLPSAVVTTTLSHIGAVFRRSSQLSRSPRRPSSAAPPTPGKMTAKDRKLLKMILVIFASFVTCYLPITVSKTTFRHNSMETRWLNIAGYILIYLTTCINPIIYVVMSSEYRQAYKNLLMCRTGDSSSHNNGAHGHNNQPHNNNKNRG